MTVERPELRDGGRVIPTPLHALLDGLSALALAAAPGAFGWPAPLHRPLRAAAVGVAGYSLMTRYMADSRAPISMPMHLAIDAAQGAAFLLAAAALPRLPPSARIAMAGYGLFSIAAAVLTERRAAPSTRQVPVPKDSVARVRRIGPLREVATGVAYLRLGLVNVALLGLPGAGDRGWVLVDAGLRGTAGMIRAAAAARFGPGARPAAIILTHGHFDHVDAVKALARDWEVPVFAHGAELPYLTGQRHYAPATPEVGGGLVAALSPLYPIAPIDLGARVAALPGDGRVPGAPGWRWLHTPGHTSGHVSLWQGAGRVLLSGDAVITTRQEALGPVVLQSPELHGPPAYFTPDWVSAARSAELLAGLEPEVLVSGHGPALAGPGLRRALHRLAQDFRRIAVPRQITGG